MARNNEIQQPDESIESKWLRENWNTEILGKFDGMWIAVMGTIIIASNESDSGILNDINRYFSDVPIILNPKPLLAYVYFGQLQ